MQLSNMKNDCKSKLLVKCNTIYSFNDSIYANSSKKVYDYSKKKV